MSYLLVGYLSGQDWISWTLGETVVFRKSVKEQLMGVLTGLCIWISDLPMLYLVRGLFSSLNFSL